MCMYGNPVDLTIELHPTEHFYHYSVLYWAEHFKRANVTDEDDNMLALSREFVFDEHDVSLSFITWIDAIKEFSEALPRYHDLKRALSAVSSSTCTPIFTACVFGLFHLLTALPLSDDFDWNQKNDTGHTSLYLACAFGHDCLVKIPGHRSVQLASWVTKRQ